MEAAELRQRPLHLAQRHVGEARTPGVAAALEGAPQQVDLLARPPIAGPVAGQQRAQQHVLGQVPRELYVPEGYRELAFADMEIPLAHGQQMMAPKVEGRLLQSLALESADRVLEVGTGSGFMTACLAQLADTVLSVDIFSDFTSEARRKLDEAGIDNVELQTADALAMGLKKTKKMITSFESGRKCTVFKPAIRDILVDQLKQRFSPGRKTAAPIREPETQLPLSKS